MVKDSNKRLDFLENMRSKKDINDDDFKMLKQLSSSEDWEVKCNLAEVLYDIYSDKSELILLDLLEDEDELVRVNACDSLSKSKNVNVYNRLKDIYATDSDITVSKYAIYAMVDIAKSIQIDENQVIEFLSNQLEQHDNLDIKLPMYRGLYLMGQTSSLYDILKELDDEIYQKRCAAINVLEEILNDDNKEIIRESLMKLKSVEPTRAVMSSIDILLDKIGFEDKP